MTSDKRQALVTPQSVVKHILQIVRWQSRDCEFLAWHLRVATQVQGVRLCPGARLRASSKGCLSVFCSPLEDLRKLGGQLVVSGCGRPRAAGVGYYLPICS